MMPAELKADRLYLFVIGPGFGESIVIHVPPGNWIVIDSCKPGERAAALEVLSRYTGKCTCVVLTHRHEDHWPGFSEVISHAEWNIIGCTGLRLPSDSRDAQNPERHRANELEDIMAAILTRWTINPATRWLTWRRTEQQVGDAVLASLHPTEEFAQQNPHANPNSLSAAMLLKWKNVRLLLGADVESPHWDEIRQDYTGLGDHSGMKAPHHGSHQSTGSRGALHSSFLDGPNDRFWVVTPYNKGKRRPGMADGEGVYQLLQHVAELHLTGLPVSHDRQSEQPCKTTRSECNQGIRPRPLSVDFAGGITGIKFGVNGGFKCYVVAEFSADGICEHVFHGPGSILLTE